MASENVKIVIEERDNTTPVGSGIDSTDIAFIPGFAQDGKATKNQPVLCTTIKEFEAQFGKTPRKLTALDVADYADYGFKVNDYDRSYIFAKELLNRGMSVVYVNMMSDAAYEDCLFNDNSVQFYVPDGKFNPNTVASIGSNAGVIKVTATSAFKHEVQMSFKTSITVEGGSTETFDYLLDSVNNFKNVTSCVSIANPNQCHSIITQLSSTQYQFDNKLEETDEIHLSVLITADVDLVANECATMNVKTAKSSVLDAFYKNDIFTNILTEIADKSVYSVKYITSGGYPAVVGNINKFATQMIKTAATRGDAVALIDYMRDENLTSFGVDDDSFYAKMNKMFEGIDGTEYGTMMYPWATYTCSTLNSEKVDMPASFAYLNCLARTIKTSPNWLAIAGVTRGLVPSINELLVPNGILTNTHAEEMQPKFGSENQRVSINCITNIRPYGLTLWGNRTLKPVSKDGTVALNFLNVRNMLSDIKKVLYTTAKSVMFEQNSESLWLRFKNGVNPLLYQMKMGNAIADYKIIKGTTKYNGDPLTKGEMAAVIKIYPMYAVEYFELVVEINDEEVTIS